MSLPHFVHVVSFFGLLSLALSLCFTSWSYQYLGRETTERQCSTWRDDFHNSAAVSNTHAPTRTRVCNSIVLTSWQDAYTLGFPRQQVCKFSNVDVRCVCAYMWSFGHYWEDNGRDGTEKPPTFTHTTAQGNVCSMWLMVYVNKT